MRPHHKPLYYLFYCLMLCIIASCNNNDNREDLFLIKSGNQYGFINREGKVVITPQFDEAKVFRSNNLAPFKLDGKWGYINRKGEIIIAAQYDETFCFPEDESVARIKLDEKYGYINSEGVVIISPQFDYAYPFREKHAIVVKGDSLGVINITGNVLYIEKAFNVSILGDSLPMKDYGFSEGLSPIESYTMLDDNDTDDFEGVMAIGYSYVDTLGNIINGKTYLSGWPVDRSYHCGYAVYDYLHERYGFINHNGEIVIDTIYDDVDAFSEGIAAVCIKDKWGFIDTTGNIIVEAKYDGRGKCTEGFMAVKEAEKWGFLKSTGEILVSPQYDWVSNFSEGMAQIKKDDKWGYIDTSGEVVISIQYHELSPFYKGLARVINDDGRWMYINKHGDTVWKDEVIALNTSPNIYDWGINDLSQVRLNTDTYRDYFNANIRDLDPLEGLYQVYVRRVSSNPYTGQKRIIEEHKEYWAICKTYSDKKEYTDNNRTNNFVRFCAEEDLPLWFHKIGGTNVYDITPIGSGSRVVVDNPMHHIFNSSLYNFIPNRGMVLSEDYDEYELIKDYPTIDMIESMLQSEWSGTGFAIGDSYLATNYHVVNGARRISVIDDSEEPSRRYNAQVVAFDNKNDLAILKIIDSKFEDIEDIPYAFKTSLADVGEDVFVLGYPLTTTMGEEIKLSIGIISSSKGYQDNNALYQISSPIQPGNSGGPLFDSNGDIIGIVCAKHKDAENAGYAVKMLYLDNLIKKYNLPISLSKDSDIHSKSLPKKVKKVKGFVYKIECGN